MADLKKLQALFKASLQGVKVASLDLSREPFVLSAELTPQEALKLISERHVRSAPVVNSKTNPPTFAGVFDMRDFAKHAVDQYRKEHQSKSDVRAMSILAMAPHITTNSLSYLAAMRKFRTVKQDDDILNLVKLFAEGSHVVGVLNDKGELITVLTQGTTFNQIYKLWHENGALQEALNATLVADLQAAGVGASKDKCVTTIETTPAHTVFELMEKHSLSSIGVLDENGALLQNTSATDIQLWLQGAGSLELDIVSFLQLIRKKAPANKTKFPVSRVHGNDTFAKVLDRLEKTHYHILWVSDEFSKPEGVLALSDIYKIVSA